MLSNQRLEEKNCFFKAWLLINPSIESTLIVELPTNRVALSLLLFRAQATLVRALLRPNFSGNSVFTGVVKRVIISNAFAKLFCSVRSVKSAGNSFCSSSSLLKSYWDYTICFWSRDSISSESEESSKSDLTSSISFVGLSYGELSVDVELPNWLLLKVFFVLPKDSSGNC